MDVDAQPVGVESDRLLDTLRAVDRVECGMGVEHDLAVAIDGALARAHQLVDVRLFDRMSAELDLDIGDVADQSAGAVARPDIIDRHARHALGEFDRLAHRELACRHVGDITALDPAALALASPEHAQPTLIVEGHDERAHLGRADVECGDQFLFGGLCHGEPSAFRRRCAGVRFTGDRFAGFARQAHGHLARFAQVDADDMAAEQAVRAIGLGELGQREARLNLPLG